MSILSSPLQLTLPTTSSPVLDAMGHRSATPKTPATSEYPSCLQTTRASLALQLSSATGTHELLRNTSTKPAFRWKPLLSRTAPEQREQNTVTARHHDILRMRYQATQTCNFIATLAFFLFTSFFFRCGVRTYAFIAYLQGMRAPSAPAATLVTQGNTWRAARVPRE